MQQQFTAVLYPRKAKLRTPVFQFSHLIFSCKCKALQLQMSCQSRQWVGNRKAPSEHKKTSRSIWLRLVSNQCEMRSISSCCGAPYAYLPDASPHFLSCAYRHYGRAS
ncbi:hypothetical protein DK867_07875 [Ochrobactrum sp. POC9]|nr:hypothetical protein DK867_07875 [Ochrobactrum sp. POC9]